MIDYNNEGDSDRCVFSTTVAKKIIIIKVNYTVFFFPDFGFACQANIKN